MSRGLGDVYKRQNLYYICNVPEKDKLDNSLKFIEENIDKWIFFVTNETEED